MDIKFELFEHLIKSPSKEFLNQIILESFNFKENSRVSDNLLEQLSESLEIDQVVAEELLKGLQKLIKKLLFDGCTDLQQIQNVLASSNLQANLQSLLSKLLVERLAQFRDKLINEEGMLPKLLEFDWRVDIKMASNLSTTDSSAKSGQQTCILQLKTTEEQTEEGKPLLPRTISLSKQPILDISEIINQQFKKRSEKQLGLLSYLARMYPNDKCGSNGLPLTPNSIRIYGKFQQLKTLVHKNLCRYIDIQRGQNERLFIISEHYSLCLNDLLNDTYIYNLIIANSTILLKWIGQLLKSFNYLSEHGIVNRLVSLKNVCISPRGDIKLANYGMFHMSECGYCVNFPIVNYATMAPECYLLEYVYANKNLLDCPSSNSEILNSDLNNPKADVWSFGCILFQFIFGLSTHTQSSQKQLSELLSPERLLNLSIDLFTEKNIFQQDTSGYQFMLQVYDIDQQRQNQVEQKTKPIFLKLIKKCLTVNPVDRPNFREVYAYFCELLNESKVDLSPDESFESIKLKLFKDKIRIGYLEQEQEEEEDRLWRRGVDEVYCLWRLAAGDCLQTLKQNGRLKSNLMPIHKFSVYTTVENGYEHGKVIRDDEISFDQEIVPISLQQLRNRLDSVKPETFYPLIEKPEQEQEQIHEQPLNIRELDIEYQFNRMILFSRYLMAYPFKRNEFFKECRKDIPPLYRNLAWCALLDVDSNISDTYARINKEQITSTDRQIDVDIPRCHQYDPLMASPQAHIKLKRILKSWVLSNPNLVYWQGLDSLCAPFLYLNFNSEELAFGCLTNFVNKYAAKFFLKDNSEVIHEYLAVFSHLIAFHDPELAAHFESIDFRPDLYAIPWFLTMFAHVFPLYKIFHLWDTLLLGSSAFPLCIGAAILKQLRNILLNSDFNECILLFSELPEINIEKCVIDSKEIFCRTPASCLYREHSGQEVKEKEDLEFEMTPIGLEKMRAELCPQISARDILNLSDTKMSKVILIDIRPSVEFSQGFILNSKNVPYEQINFTKLSQANSIQINSQPSESDSTQCLVYYLQQYKNLLKIIVCSEESMENAVDLANRLVRLKYTKICILNKGIECFRTSKIISTN